MSSKVWTEITYAFPNFNDCTVDVWEWICNIIPHKGRVYLSMPVSKLNHLSNWSQDISWWFVCERRYALMEISGSHKCMMYSISQEICTRFLLCCALLWLYIDFPISIRLTSLALWQSNDCPSASKATLMNMDKYFMWINYERLHNHNKAKHNKTVCIFLGIYCMLSYIRKSYYKCSGTTLHSLVLLSLPDKSQTLWNTLRTDFVSFAPAIPCISRIIFVCGKCCLIVKLPIELFKSDLFFTFSVVTLYVRSCYAGRHCRCGSTSL